MGFIPSSSTIQLYAYFTEYARERIFNGEVSDFQVRHFSLHDDDINYQISKEIIGVDSSGNTLYNTLQSGFIPDITGDLDSCIKSNKNTIVFGRNMLTGTTQVSTPIVFGCTNPLASNYNENANVDDGSCIIPPTPIRTLVIAIEPISFVETNVPNGFLFTHEYTFNVVLKTQPGDTTPITPEERAATSFFVAFSDSNINNISYINSYSFDGVSTLKTFSTNSNILTIGVNFTQRPNISEPLPFQTNTSTRTYIYTNSQNRIVDTDKRTFTYTKTLVWN